MTAYIRATTTTGALALVVLLLTMVVTTPLSLGPLGVTGWFLVLLIVLGSGGALVAYAAGTRLQPGLPKARQVANSWRRGLLVGGFITANLALSSLRQLNARDVVLLLILLILVEFYTVARQ